MTLKWAERLTKVEILAPCHSNSSLWNMLRRLKSNKISLVVSVQFQRITHSSWNGR